MTSFEDITFDRQEKAKEYARIRRRLLLIDLVWNGLYAVSWLLGGFSYQLRDLLTVYTQNQWLLIAFFVMVYGGINTILSLPLNYYSDFVLPHRFGMSNETQSTWISDQIKNLLISAPFGLIVIEIIYALLRANPDTWWLWGAGVMLAFTILLFALGPVLIAPLFNKYVPLGEEHTDLKQRLLALAEKTHTKVQGVFKFDMSRRTKGANAALTGVGKSRRIIIGDTLIEEFTPEEIETVLAHELGHQVNKDIPTGILINTLIILVGFYLADICLRWALGLFQFENIADIAALPLLTLVIGLFSMLTMPLINAYSRWRERKADQFSLETTHKTEAFISAMSRLANQNLAEIDPEPWVVFFLYSHPPIRDRIAMASSFSKKV